MAELAPVDELTDVPLLIAPIKGLKGRSDGHHRIFYGDDEDLQHEDARPLRYVSIQQIKRKTHEEFNEAYDGILFPADEHRWFRATVLMAAGYITPDVVDFSGDSPAIIPTTEKMREWYQRPGVLRLQRGTRWRVGAYFGRYLLASGIGEVAETRQAKRFLSEKDPLRRMQAGYELIRLAADVATSPIERDFRLAHEQERMVSGWASAGRFVMKFFDNHQPDYFNEVHRKIALARGGY